MSNGTTKQTIALLLVGFMFFGCDPSGKPILGQKINIIPKVMIVLPQNSQSSVSQDIQNITATFSVPMDGTTLTSNSFTLSHGSPPVMYAGSVTYVDHVAQLSLRNSLQANTLYTATILTQAHSEDAIALASNYIWSFTTALDTVAPTVTTIDPIIHSTDVAINKSISALFSETLDPLTVTTTTYKVVSTLDNTAVVGVVSYSGNTILFNPDNDLHPSTQYTATITTGVKDLAGNALAVAKVWSFTTGVAPDTLAPTVTSVDPSIHATEVLLNKSISALFSETLDPLTVTTTTYKVVSTLDNTAVVGVVSYSGNTILFNPDNDLHPSTQYTATITTGVKDLAGNALAVAKVWSFTTGVAPDTLAPTVTAIIPSADAIDVSIDKSISVLFSEALDPLTATTATFRLATTSDAVAITGVVDYSGNTMVFNPDVNLSANTQYTATITTGVKDLAGNALAVAKVWNFTTAATASIALAGVDLGSAGTFAILTKTGITTTGATSIIGDVGASPIALTSLTGFTYTVSPDGTFATSDLVVGKIYGASLAAPTPANLSISVSDMEHAYADAIGRTEPDFTNIYTGVLGGENLVPGLYKWTTGVLVSGAGLTLTGSATDVWIFQITGALTLNTGAVVTLAGGALAENVFWQITNATLETSSELKGIVLSAGVIIMQTGATVEGRLLTQTAVTLVANTITQPN